MAKKTNKSLMRNLGEFVGHIVKGAKSDPAKRKQVIRKDVTEEKRDGITLRRTTIEEIEMNHPDKPRQTE